MCQISPGREFQAAGATLEKERGPNVSVLSCGMRRVLELEEERRCIDGVYTKKTRLVNKSCSSDVANR